MGIVTVRHGLDGRKETYSFNGKIGKRITGLNWEHCLIMRNGTVLSPAYRVKPEDVLLIQEFPGAATTVSLIIMGVTIAASLTVGIVSAVQANKAYRQAEQAAEEARRAQENALKGQSSVSGARKIAGAENAQAEGSVLPFILGRHLFAPYYLCSPYITVSDTDDGSDQYWYGVFIVGQNNLALSKLKLGTNILREADITPGSVIPFDSGSIYYDHENIIEVADGTDFLTDIFNQKWAASKEGQAQLEWKYDQDSPVAVTRETCPQCHAVEVEIGLPALYGINTETGENQHANVLVYVGWSNDDGRTWHKMNIEGWIPGLNYDSLTRNKNKEMRFIARKTFTAAESYKKQILIKAERRNKDTENVNGQRNVYLYSVRSRMYAKDSTPAGLTPAGNVDDSIKGKITRIGVKIKAGENTNGKLNKFNLIACMKGRTYRNGGWSGNAEITNAADVALEVLTGSFHAPSAIEDDEIDLPSFGAWHDHCENQIVVVDGVPRMAKLNCNDVLTTGVKKADILSYAVSASDAGVYINELGKYIAYFETPGGIPVAMVNPQNIVRLTYSKSFEVIPDGFKFEYIDEEDGYQVQTKRILRNGVASAPGMNTYQSVKLDCVTNYLQACWLMRRTLAKQTLRPTAYKLSVGMEGRYYRPGDILLVQDETLKLGIGSGEIRKVYRDNTYVYGIETMEYFDFEAGRNYVVQWQAARPGGNRIYSAAVEGTGQYTNKMMFSVPMPMTGSNAEYMPDLEDIVSVTHDGATKFVCGDAYARTDDGYELDIFEYNEAIYRTGPIPARVSSLVGAIGEVDPVHVPQRPVTGFEVSELAREAASAEAEKARSGTYLGVVTAAPDSKSGPRITVVKGPATGPVDANMNDYFLFGTDNITGWVKGTMYQWDGVSWLERSSSAYNALYASALDDICDYSPRGSFMQALIGNLVAKTAMIEDIQAELIQIKNAIFGGERFTKSADGKSVIDNGADKPGFLLNANGQLLASDAVISGYIEADRLEAGPLLVSSGAPQGITRNFSINTTAERIYDTVNRMGIFDATGTYGSSAINKIEFVMRLANDDNYWGIYKEIFVYINNSRTLIARSIMVTLDTTNHPLRLASPLSFTIVFPGKTLKLLNIPDVKPDESGTVYKERDGDTGTFILKIGG